MILDGKRIDRAEAIEPIDTHIGARVRAGRELRGWSRRKLSEAIGVSAQQIQKWEDGTNRVYANRLWAVAMALNLQINWFFEGFRTMAAAAHSASGSLNTSAAELTGMMTPENIHLLEQFTGLSTTQQRLVRQVMGEFVALMQRRDDEREESQGGEALADLA